MRHSRTVNLPALGDGHIVALSTMVARLVVLALLMAAASPIPAYAQRKQAKEQVEFGIQVAQRGLWKEAIYRWERATQLDPTYAAAFNNLAVAYEHEGLLQKAREAYEKALAIEPENSLVRQNYDLFKEINDRAAQKDGR
jgi:Tfp pilus assembly protein PilF